MKKYIILCLSICLTMACSGFLEEYSNDLKKVEGYADLDELLIGDGYWRPNTVYTPYYGGGDNLLLPLHFMSDETEIYREISSDFYYFESDLFGYIAWQQQVGRNYKGSVINDEDKSWNELYKRINVVNQVIADIESQPAANQKEELEKTRIRGEAHFLRAVYYFTLVNMYARPYTPETAETEPGVPLKLSRQIEHKLYETAALSEVYATVLEDLAVAREDLRRTSAKNHPYRADITAAYLFSSRVCLYMQDWKGAYDYADSVIQRKNTLIDLNTYQEETGVNILNRDADETIFTMGGHILAQALFARSTAYQMIPTFIIPDNLVGLYGEEGDENDLRRGIYIRQIYPFSYSNRFEPVWVFNKIDGLRRWSEGRTPCDVSDVFLMRVAEAYLNGAEAAAQMQREEEAVRLLQELRSHRVQNDNAVYGSGKELVKFIREERERELCLEGHRWFDLRRYTVDKQYPFSKQIIHYYTDFYTQTPSGRYQTLRYILEENDPAYTLALPKEVTEFQNTLPSVVRPGRPGTVYDEM